MSEGMKDDRRKIAACGKFLQFSHDDVFCTITAVLKTDNQIVVSILSSKEIWSYVKKKYKLNIMPF